MPKAGIGERPEGLIDTSSTKQSEIRTVSVIREVLWNKAKWKGVLFGNVLNDAGPPMMAPIFGEAGPAKEIFKQWVEELGESDPRNLLRMSLVTGISRQHPHWYRLMLGSDLAAAFRENDVRFGVSVSRVHTMTPDSGDNLQRFLRSFQNVGRYILLAATFNEGQSTTIPRIL
jgi:hypothetical protein